MHLRVTRLAKLLLDKKISIATSYLIPHVKGRIWPVKSGAKLKPGCYSDMTLNFFSPSKSFANNGCLIGIDKMHFSTFQPKLSDECLVTPKYCNPKNQTSWVYDYISELRHKWQKYWTLYQCYGIFNFHPSIDVSTNTFVISASIPRHLKPHNSSTYL